MADFDNTSTWDAEHVLMPWREQGGPRGPEITKADGVYFWDRAGKRYLDFTSQFVFANFGHNERRVIDAIGAQANALVEIATPFPTAPRSEAAHLLATVTPGDLNRVFFSTSGAEANEAAFKFAKELTERPLVCARYRSYHGSTYGAMTLSRNPATWAYEPGVPNVIYAPGCDPYHCRFAPPGKPCSDCGEHCAEDLQYVLLQHGPDRVAGVIVEPIVGSSGGVIVPGDGYLSGVREICDRFGILLIADEVMTGFGRTGRWFASDHWSVVPDIMTMAKGLTGGYVPMGATIVRENHACFWDAHPLAHGHTYTGHTLGCAAIVASIKVYQEDDLVRSADRMGAYLMERVLELKEKHPSVGDVRGKGLFVGVELVRNRHTKEPISSEKGAAIKRSVIDRSLREGTFLMSGFSPDTLMLCPPLTIDKAQIDEGVAAVDVALLLADEEIVP